MKRALHQRWQSISPVSSRSCATHSCGGGAGVPCSAPGGGGVGPHTGQSEQRHESHSSAGRSLQSQSQRPLWCGLQRWWVGIGCRGGGGGGECHTKRPIITPSHARARGGREGGDVTARRRILFFPSSSALCMQKATKAKWARLVGNHPTTPLFLSSLILHAWHLPREHVVESHVRTNK